MTDESTESESNQIEPGKELVPGPTEPGSEPGTDTDLIDPIEPILDGTGFAALGKLLDQNWWQRTLTFIWIFRKHTLTPSILLAITGMIQNLMVFSMASVLFQAEPMTVNDLQPRILMAIGICLALGISALVCCVISIGMFLIRLTGFCRAFLSLEPETDLTNMEAVEYLQTEAVNKIRQKKPFLVAVWLLWSLFMAIPSSIGGAAGTILLLSMPGVLPTPVPLPLEWKIGCIAVSVVTLILLTNYGLLTMALSGRSKKGSLGVVVESLKYSIVALPAITVFSILALVFGMGATYFLEVVKYFMPTPAVGDLKYLAICLISSGWQGVSAIIIYPLCLAIPCEMIRTNKKPE